MRISRKLPYSVVLLTSLLVLTAFGLPGKLKKIKPLRSVSLRIKEPSDICLSPSGNSFYIVSDNGVLYETDLEGKILRQAKETGYDFEGVYCDDEFIYVADEMTRKVHLYTHDDLKIVKSVRVPYSGGRNHGYESITWNKKKQALILITEDNPTWIFELGKEYNVVNEVKFTRARDISAATWHNGYLWFLSDEDRTVFKVDPDTYGVLDSWQIPVLNPEGITFDKNGQLVIVSDDLGRLYYFNNPDNANQ